MPIQRWFCILFIHFYLEIVLVHAPRFVDNIAWGSLSAYDSNNEYVL